MYFFWGGGGGAFLAIYSALPVGRGVTVSGRITGHSKIKKKCTYICYLYNMVAQNTMHTCGVIGPFLHAVTAVLKRRPSPVRNVY